MSPQAFISSYAPRLRTYGNSLLAPVVPPTAAATTGARTTKRGTTAINYAENEYDDDDIFEDSEPRRATGLRSRKEDPNQGKETAASKLGKEIHRPVEVQGIWRDWMGKMRPVSFLKTERQRHFQTALPLTLIPIRLDVDIQPFIPAPALPIPPQNLSAGVNINANPAYRSPEQTPTYRLKDFFLWNLHESLITPDQFASGLIFDLDLPNSVPLISEISRQIRSQLEEYAGVALHPLFHSTENGSMANASGKKTRQGSNSREPSNTPAATPQTNGINGAASPAKPSFSTADTVTATAASIPVSRNPAEPPDPDDTYRCIVTLNINLQNKLYTDKFEWSLLHPVGYAETFAKHTCADMGLSGDWVPAVAHAIYEAVLKLKKEACESGGLVGSINGYGGEIDNMTASDGGAGWRYDHETLGVEWEPRLETLSKEEIEKKEGDRERQLRRLRRETARFSSTANMIGGIPDPRGAEEEPQALGRGERAKKKKRYRSLSPQRATPDLAAAGFGGGGISLLTDVERNSWRCTNCATWSYAVWGVRDGPRGPRSLCNNCGLAFERDKRLPPWAKNMHVQDVPVGHMVR